MSSLANGSEHPTNCGTGLIVIKYNSPTDVLVKSMYKFGHEQKVTAGQVRSGQVKNPFKPSVFGKGFLGVGKHSSRIDGKNSKAYKAWQGMLERVYSEKFSERHPTYKGCSVSLDWLNFQNFADWFYSQDFLHDWELDKDILFYGNKRYSAETCCLIPKQINTLLGVKRHLSRELPEGVYLNSCGKKYSAAVSFRGSKVHLGTFSCKEEAHLAFKSEKESIVRSVARDYEGVVRFDVFDSLMNYEA